MGVFKVCLGGVQCKKPQSRAVQTDLNWFEPVQYQTDADQFRAVHSSFFGKFPFIEPVQSAVHPKKEKRPDWTGLLNSSFLISTKIIWSVSQLDSSGAVSGNRYG